MTIAQTTCPTCGQPRMPDAMFCHHCGRQLQIRCQNCSAGNPDDSAYCHKCGTRITAQMAAGTAAPAGTPPYAATGGFSTSPAQVSARISCPRCRSTNDAGSRFCYSCGLPLEGASPATGQLLTPTGAVVGVPAGFWVRFGAIMIDGIILNVVGAMVKAALGEPFLGEPLPAGAAWTEYFVFTTGDRLNVLVDAAYHVVGWSVFGTTIGKRVFGLYVLRRDGAKISIWRALWRYIARHISGMIFLIGYLMVAFRKDKRGLHDLLADTYVVKK